MRWICGRSPASIVSSPPWRNVALFPPPPTRARAIEVSKLPDSFAHGAGAARRGFTPNVIEGNLGRVRAGSEDEGGARPVAVPVMGRIAAGTPIEAIQKQSQVINRPAGV